MTERRSSLLFLIAALALVPLMPSGDSIWVDEAQTWRYARHDSLAEVWAEFRTEKFSEAQMPLGMAAAWSWAQLLGTSEWALRAPNMVYAVGAILCFYLIGRRERIPLMPLFLAVQPFLWFYVNEARPYALQVFGGSLLLLALYEVYRGHLSSAKWSILWTIGALIASASSMLGAIPTLAVTVAMGAELLRRRLLPHAAQLLALAAGTIPLLGLGVYYLSTLMGGAGGAKIWSVGLQNAIFSAIEFLGFAGLLPARHELRSIARAGLTHPDELLALWPFAISASVLLVLLFAIGLYWILNWRKAPRWVSACLFVAIASAGLLLAASLVVGFPFWGRHLAAAFPVFVGATCWAVWRIWRGTSSLFRFASAALVVVLLSSSFMLRFSDLHARDDYRSATKSALEALSRNHSVWWAADKSAARYYGAHFLGEPNTSEPINQQDGLHYTANLQLFDIHAFPNPDIIIISKRDIYDRAGALQEWLRIHKFREVARRSGFEFYAASSSVD